MANDHTSISERPIVCPSCKTTTTLANIRCPNCGVNLVLAVARAAQDMLAPSSSELNLPYEADRFLPRFGDFLLRQGDITKAQLDQALDRQKSGSGQHRTLGQILLEMGAVNREQLDRASLNQIQDTQKALHKVQDDLDAALARTRQLETALSDMAGLNMTAIDLIDSAREQVSLAAEELGRSDHALELSEVTAVLNGLEAALVSFTARNR